MRNTFVLTAIAPLLLASCTLHSSSTSQLPDYRVGVSDCPVHEEQLVETTQKVDDSRVSHHPLYWRIRDALFPAAFTPSDDGEVARVKYCRSCRVAKALCENDKEYEGLYSFLPLDDASREQHNREVDEFIERQRQQLSQAMSLPGEQSPNVKRRAGD